MYNLRINEEVIYSTYILDLNVCIDDSWGCNDEVYTSALEEMPQYVPQCRFSRITFGDGNCFARCLSYLVYKCEERHLEMWMRFLFEGVIHEDSYIDGKYLVKGHDGCANPCTIVEKHASYSSIYYPTKPLQT